MAGGTRSRRGRERLKGGSAYGTFIKKGGSKKWRQILDKANGKTPTGSSKDAPTPGEGGDAVGPSGGNLASLPVPPKNLHSAEGKGADIESPPRAGV